MNTPKIDRCVFILQTPSNMFSNSKTFDVNEFVWHIQVTTEIMVPPNIWNLLLQSTKSSLRPTTIPISKLYTITTCTFFLPQTWINSFLVATIHKVKKHLLRTSRFLLKQNPIPILTIFSKSPNNCFSPKTYLSPDEVQNFIPNLFHLVATGMQIQT